MFQIKDHNQRGEFIVRVSKYNNKFEISLRVGVKEYPLKKNEDLCFSYNSSWRRRGRGTLL